MPYRYLLTFIRGLRRRKGLAFVNVFGLALGVACCLLILHFVQDELAFDRFHEKGDRIYRLVSEGEFPAVGWPYGRILEEEYPEVEEVVYMRTWPSLPILHEGERYYERMRYAEGSFFEVFDFPLVEGNGTTALTDPYAVVLSEELAHKLFGDERALGRTLTIGDSTRVEVTGVARVPRQSHIQFDALLSLATFRAFNPESYDSQSATGWLNMNMINYVLLREGTDTDAFAAKVRDLPAQHAGEALRAWGSDLYLGLEPLREIYLHSDLGSGLGPSGDIAHIYLLGVVGLFILLLAGVNFVNLATARAGERAKEVGVRKAIGSSPGALVRQFLTESTLTALLAVLLGAGLAWLALPSFNELADRGYDHAALVSPALAAALVGFVVLIGILAGLYPALVLSRFRPIEVLRGPHTAGRRGIRLRQALVVFQFAVSCVLVVGTLVVLSQLRYMQSQHLGFDKEQVLVLDAQKAPALAHRWSTLKEELAVHPAIQRVSATYAVPGRRGWRGQLAFPEDFPEGQSVSLEYIPVDHDYVETLGLEVIAGRDLDAAFPTDADAAVMINEAAVQAAGWTSPAEAIGKQFTSPGSNKPDGVVIGVVRDYHHHGLQERIEPIMYGINPWALGLFALRIDATQTTSVVAHIERTWERLFEGYPSEFYFLDEGFAQQYGHETRLAKIFGTFASLAIVIACLGLFALAAFTAERRRKEIGVRKVLGASVGSIVVLLARDFAALVLIGFAVAAPLAWLGMGRWLDGFAYRVELGPLVFAVAGLLALAVALVTVSSQALRAATADPVKNLRYE